MKSKIKETKFLIIGILLFCFGLLSAFGFLTMNASVLASAQEVHSSDADIDGDLLELTEEQCIDFVESRGIDIPKDLRGQSEIGGFIKSVIVSCVEDPTYKFGFNYSVTQNFVEEIQAVVNEYYNREFENEVSTVASVAYTLQDSEVVSDENVEGYNCYSYAIGRTEKWYNPGDFSGGVLDYTTTVSEIAQLVKNDLNALGYYDVVVSAEKPEIDSEANLICVRKGYYGSLLFSGYDYHFMKYDNGSWYHKPSGTAILKYKYEPDYKYWTNERYHNGTYYDSSITYDSDIYYIRYYTEKPLYYELFDGGVGSIQNPFLISSVTQFRNIGLAYRSVYVPRQGYENRIDYSFKLENSITISGDWTPFTYKFVGDFDGAGYYVSYNMYLSQVDIDANSNQGLFGYVVDGGKIHDLELMNCSITSDTNTELSRKDNNINIGIVAGSFLEAGNLTNVTVTNPKIECKISGASIGAIAGTFFYTSTTNCVVRKQGENGISAITNNTRGYIGGMAGFANTVTQFSGGSVTISLTNNVFDGSQDMIGKVIGNERFTGSSEISEEDRDKLLNDNNITADVAIDTGGGCLARGTLITLADGTQKPVEALTGDEMLLVWNLYTGQYDVAPILFIDCDAAGKYTVIDLAFSDGTSVEVIYEHGFWDYDLNKYVYLDKDAAQYIGHWFNKQTLSENGEFISARVQLIGVTIQEEETTAYSPVTYGHLCYFVNGMLSMPGGIEGLFNIFEVDAETMSYDRDLMQEDIEQYGLFTYEEFAELVPVSREVFEAFNGQYLKVAIGKDLIDISTLNDLVNRYAKFLGNL